MEIDRGVCETALDGVFGAGNYEIEDWKLEGFDQVLGFHGRHSILRVTVDSSGRKKNLTFFVKSASPGTEIFEYYSKIRCFEKEYFMLKQVVDELQSQVDEKLTSKCYVNELNRFSVSEDLMAIGFKSSERALEWDHVLKSVEKLAVLHAASVVLEEKTGVCVSQRFPSVCFETFMNSPDTAAGAVAHSTNTVFRHFVSEKVQDLPSRDKREFADWVLETLLQDYRPSREYRNVVCHGDPWFMNFMFRYTEQGDVDDVMLVDFQASRIAPPALELQQFLALRYFRKEMMTRSDTALDVYYESFSKTLEKAGLEASAVLSKAELRESFDRYRAAGVVSKALYAVTTSLPQRFLGDMDSSQFLRLMAEGDVQLCSRAFDSDAAYRKVCLQSIKGAYAEFLVSVRRPPTAASATPHHPVL